MSSTSTSSSEDDEYNYCNAAARFKALKTQKRAPPRASPPREKPREAPVEKTRTITLPVEEPTRNGSVRSVTRGSQCRNRDYVESISDSSSSYVDENIIELSSTDGQSPRALETPIEILDSPPRQSLNDSNLDGLDDTIVDNLMVDVYVRWRSNKIESFHLEKYEPLLKIFQKFADQESIPVNRIIITRRDMILKPNDTPASLKLSIIDILEGGIISAELLNHRANHDEEDDEDMCKIKAQVSAKKSVMYKLRKDEPFKKLREHCSKELEVSVERIKFYFDGDQVEDLDTPNILDLDDEACIDVKIVT